MHPFNPNPESTVGRLGELELIRRIVEWLGPVNPPPPEGIGDDCAVYSAGDGVPQLMTADPVIYGCHFDDSVDPEAVGAKLLKRNISDIAAMGGRPRRAVLSLALPAATDIEWLRRFFDGLRDCAAAYSIKVVGGDVAQADDFLAAFLTLAGDAPSGRVLSRTGASIGDHLLVTGELGGSLYRHHIRFTPRVEEGLWLASRPEVRSMIDLSDGVAKDLPALLPPGAQAVLDWSSLPVRAEARRHAEKNGTDPWRHAVCDGEDYELLFTLDGKQSVETFLERWKERLSCPVRVIGRLEKLPEHAGEAAPIRAPAGHPELANLHAYEHFRRRRSGNTNPP